MKRFLVMNHSVDISIILDNINFDDNNNVVVKNIIEVFYNKYEFLGIGRNRAVFKLSANNVIKVPINDYGVCDNSYEAFNKKDVEYGIPRSKAFVLSGIALLIMEYIQHVQLDNPPDWSDYIDCRQIGYNKKGQLLAYDLA